MSLSDRERAEGFLGYCNCGTDESEREHAEDFLHSRSNDFGHNYGSKCDYLVGGGPLLSVLVLAETIVDLIGFVRDG